MKYEIEIFDKSMFSFKQHFGHISSVQFQALMKKAKGKCYNK